MEDDTDRGTVRRRARALAAALTVAGLLAAGCGGGRDKGHEQAPVATSTADAYRQAVAFARCMRAHGDPAWPDPGPGGAFPNDNGSLDKSSPRYKKASAACRNLAPAGPPPATFQAQYRRLLKFAACMRAHGVPKFPDPVLDQHGVGFSGDMDVESPQYRTAHQACAPLAGPGGAP